MQIVIDILPEEYEAICKVDAVVNVIPFRIAQVIKDGTVLPENGDWISIKERVPPIGRAVLVTKFGAVQLAYRTDDTADGSICWVTHHGAYEREEETNIKAWMPLPEPYKG